MIENGGDEGRVERVYTFWNDCRICSKQTYCNEQRTSTSPTMYTIGDLGGSGHNVTFSWNTSIFFQKCTILRQQRNIYPPNSESFGEQRKPCILASAYPLLHFQCSCLTQQLEHLHWKIPKTVELKQKKKDICKWIVLDAPKLWCT